MKATTTENDAPLVTQSGNESEVRGETESNSETPAILSIRDVTGGNCSSVGSVVDMLFATATVTGAIFVTVNTLLQSHADQGLAPEINDASRDDEAKQNKVAAGDETRTSVDTESGLR